MIVDRWIPELGRAVKCDEDGNPLEPTTVEPQIIKDNVYYFQSGVRAKEFHKNRRGGRKLPHNIAVKEKNKAIKTRARLKELEKEQADRKLQRQRNKNVAA